MTPKPLGFRIWLLKDTGIWGLLDRSASNSITTIISHFAQVNVPFKDYTEKETRHPELSHCPLTLLAPKSLQSPRKSTGLGLFAVPGRDPEKILLRQARRDWAWP